MLTADMIIKASIIGLWFASVGIVSVAIYQIPVVKKWFERIGE